jgi:hypothetical protein
MTAEHDRGFTQPRFERYREACAQASTDRMLIIPGIEYSDASNIVHILVWGSARFLGERVPTGRLLETVTTENGVAVLAHPSRLNAWNVFNPAWKTGLTGLELWNRKSDGWAPSQTVFPLPKELDLVAFAGIDFHDRRQFFPLSMTLNGKATITEESVLDSLRSRQWQACAFGVSLSGNMILRALSALRAIERKRRLLARIYRWYK